MALSCERLLRLSGSAFHALQSASATDRGSSSRMRSYLPSEQRVIGPLPFCAAYAASMCAFTGSKTTARQLCPRDLEHLHCSPKPMMVWPPELSLILKQLLCSCVHGWQTMCGHQSPTRVRLKVPVCLQKGGNCGFSRRSQTLSSESLRYVRASATGSPTK